MAAAKGLSDYDVVNIGLRNDLPEWYTSINPFRKVPAIEFPDGEAIYESLIISGMCSCLCHYYLQEKICEFHWLRGVHCYTLNQEWSLGTD